ncbi:MAG: hypothetical protein IJ141_09625 [Lachnospiraceae bacterium]|nr:hypothetical protein [Lachnospiraceae bacterium]
MDEHIVEGYYFEDIREANKAKKEYFNICKLKSTISFDDIAGIKKLYVKLVGKNYFTTPIGYAFLQEMREYLVENTGETELPLIGVARTNVVKVPEVIKEKYPEISSGKYKELKRDYGRLLKTKRKLQIVIVAMAVVILGMFYIVATNENIGYFNTEEKILNKYSAWEERLNGWEEELKLKEDELNAMEKMQEK